MKSTAFAVAVALAATTLPAASETWVPDPGHTEVTVTWNHAGFSFQSLKFHEVKGSLEFEPGNVAGASADFSVVVSSVDSGIQMLDDELVGANFLDGATYPEIRFVSTEVEQTGDMTVRATGDLTIRDMTKPAVFDITVHSLGEHPVGQFFDYYKGEWLGMTATTTINRSEWGVGAFIPVGSDALDIVINTEMKAGGL